MRGAVIRIATCGVGTEYVLVLGLGGLWPVRVTFARSLALRPQLLLLFCPSIFFSHLITLPAFSIPLAPRHISGEIRRMYHKSRL